MTVKTYQNPILRGMYPDPSIVLVDDTYYLVNSTFEYYPGISLSCSTDLLNWKKLPSIIHSNDQADLNQAKSNEGIFATCIRYHKGNFYVITTNFAEFKNFIIKGTLDDDGKNIIWNNNRIEIDILGIDPDLYFENDKTYVQFTGYVNDDGTKAIQQVEIDLNSGKILNDPKILSFGTGGRDVEGPHIIKKNDWYYLLLAEGGTGVGHMVTMLRSKSLWGPYESSHKNPLFTNRDRSEEPLQNIGHADLFQDTIGNWWLTCLGTRPNMIGHTLITTKGRETLLYPVDWSDEWPSIYNGVPELIVDLTNFPDHSKTLTQQQKIIPFIDNFNKQQLNPEWVSLRNSLKTKLNIENSTLTLKGSNYQLSDIATPSFLAVRQTEINEIFELSLDTKLTKVKTGSFGIAVTIDNKHFGALLINKTTLGYDVIKTVQILDLVIHEKIGTLPTLPDKLIIEHREDQKKFIAISKEEILSFNLHAQHFSNEAIGALNTGNFCGLYVLGDASVSLKQAKRYAKT